MQLGMIGQGRMGSNMVRRLLEGGQERFRSRGSTAFQGKLLSAMRYQFGGHLEKPAPQPLEEGTPR
jgi:6-phosphogluconate dehydrogenase (decarboxylating)